MTDPTIPLDLRPMEADPVDELPEGDGWQYEPKYDGFRCIAHRAGDRVHLLSKRQKPLERYFPEVARAVCEITEPGCVFDGEIVIPDGYFEMLQLRLHPAESRIAKLSEEMPAQLIAFDLLALDGDAFLDRSLAERRTQLERLLAGGGPVHLGEATTSPNEARAWLGREGLDGIIAKRLDLPYAAGKRPMRKFKLWKTIDCVVAGVYRKGASQSVEHLLLGLYDDERRLHYVGRARVTSDGEEIWQLLKPLMGGTGFTGRAPGGKSRWSGKERQPVPLEPLLVAEVSFDHMTGEHMRHGARLLRWRSDKAPETCTMDQVR